MAKRKLVRNPLDDEQPRNVLYRIQRGLVGYVSYLAACEANVVFSEYVLYEPTLRILSACDYEVKCEVECPNVQHPLRGDKLKLDFVAEGHGVKCAIEMKWTDARTLKIENDIYKLHGFKRDDPANRAFLCIFGIERHLSDIRFSAFNDADLESLPRNEVRKGVYAMLQRTTYGCLVYEIGRGASFRDGLT